MPECVKLSDSLPWTSEPVTVLKAGEKWFLREVRAFHLGGPDQKEEAMEPTQAFGVLDCGGGDAAFGARLRFIGSPTPAGRGTDVKASGAVIETGWTGWQDERDFECCSASSAACGQGSFAGGCEAKRCRRCALPPQSKTLPRPATPPAMLDSFLCPQPLPG